MTNRRLTEIAVVLDRSGSMQSIREDMEGGFKVFLDEQRQAEGECLVSLYQFDSDYEVVYVAKPIAKVTRLNLVPRSSTALLDGVGKTLANIADRHSRLADAERPGAVIVLVITDGQENASMEWTRDQVKQAIKEAEEKRKWQMVFMAADPSAFAEGRGIGIKSTKLGMVEKSARGIKAMYGATGLAVKKYRESVARGAVNAELNIDHEDLKSKD